MADEQKPSVWNLRTRDVIGIIVLCLVGGVALKACFNV
jgi:hypothetical protein